MEGADQGHAAAVGEGATEGTGAVVAAHERSWAVALIAEGLKEGCRHAAVSAYAAGEIAAVAKLASATLIFKKSNEFCRRHAIS